MAVLSTYSQSGNKEDLIDVVTRVAVEETPFLSSIAKTKATGTLHEWMTESLDAPSDNAQIEGSAATYGTLSQRSRLNNYCQISRKTGQISDTQESVLKAGVASEYSHQVEKATKEMARDMERVLWQGTKSAGAIGTARRSGGFYNFASTNRVSLTNGVGADLAGTATAGAATTISIAAGAALIGDHVLITGGTGAGQYRVVTGVAALVLTVAAWDVAPDATSTYVVYTVPTPLTEAAMNDGIQLAKDAGGSPNAVYVSGKQKRAISGFAAGLRQVIDQNKVLTATVDIYQSDFGNMQVKYDRWTPEGTVAIVDEKMFRTAFLRPINVKELARDGSSRKFMIEGEYCLESLGESASAAVFGATL